MLEGKNIAVTGGAGFIGSHIAERLCNDNKVKVIDNLYTGLDSNLSGFSDKIEFSKTSVTDSETIIKELSGINILFHEGANVRIPDSIEDPVFDAKTNIIGTLNILEAMRKNDVKTIVFAASTSVYGDPIKLPINELHPLNPLTPYAVGKTACENYIRIYSEMYGIKSVRLRYFNVYGPRQRPDSPYSGVISIFADKIRKGENIVIYGDGNQTRDFVNVSDVVNANILAAEYGKSDVFNVGTGIPTSLNDLIDIMSEITGRKPEVDYKEARQGDARESYSDMTKIKDKLGFESKIELSEGLRELLSV